MGTLAQDDSRGDGGPRQSASLEGDTSAAQAAGDAEAEAALDERPLPLDGHGLGRRGDVRDRLAVAVRDGVADMPVAAKVAVKGGTGGRLGDREGCRNGRPRQDEEAVGGDGGRELAWGAVDGERKARRAIDDGRGAAVGVGNGVLADAADDIEVRPVGVGGGGAETGRRRAGGQRVDLCRGEANGERDATTARGEGRAPSQPLRAGHATRGRLSVVGVRLYQLHSA